MTTSTESRVSFSDSNEKIIKITTKNVICNYFLPNVPETGWGRVRFEENGSCKREEDFEGTSTREEEEAVEDSRAPEGLSANNWLGPEEDWV